MAIRRALIVDLSKRFGGADVRVEQLATGLTRRLDLRVGVIKGTQTCARFETAGLALLKLDRARKDPRLLFDLNGIIRSFRPEVVDAHNSQSILWGLPVAHAAGVPIRIATIHSIFEDSEPRLLGKQLFRALDLLVRRHATHIISVSQSVTDHLIAKGFPTTLIRTIPNGVAILPPRAMCGTRPFRIAAVGRLVPVKGLDVLLQALALVSKSIESLECNIVGDGPEHSRLRDLADSLGLSSIVNFQGYRRDPMTAIADSHLLVMPSLTEGLPFTALEAAAASVPIVASQVGGLKTYFGDENAALMVPPGNASALADAILRCIRDDDLRLALAARARGLVVERYTIEEMLRATERIYGTRSEACSHSVQMD